MAAQSRAAKKFEMCYGQLLRELIEGYGPYNFPRYGSILYPCRRWSDRWSDNVSKGRKCEDAKGERASCASVPLKKHPQKTKGHICKHGQDELKFSIFTRFGQSGVQVQIRSANHILQRISWDTSHRQTTPELYTNLKFVYTPLHIIILVCTHVSSSSCTIAVYKINYFLLCNLDCRIAWDCIYKWINPPPVQSCRNPPASHLRRMPRKREWKTFANQLWPTNLRSITLYSPILIVQLRAGGETAFIQPGAKPLASHQRRMHLN